MNPGARRKRNRKWLLLIVGLFCLLCLTPLLIILFWRLSLSGDIERLEQRARERGELFTAVEIEDAQPTPPDENNAFVPLIELWKSESASFRKAVGTGSTPGASSKERTYDPLLPVLGGKSEDGANQLPWTPEQLELARSFARTNRARAAIVSEALGRTNATYFLRHSFNTQLPHLAQIKREAGELRLLAMLAIAEGRPDDAVQRVRETVRAGDLLNGEYSLISHLVQVACWSLAMKSLEEALSFEVLHEAQILALQEAVQSINPKEALRVSLIGERALFGTIMDPLFQQTNQGVGFGNMMGGLLRATGFMEQDHRYALTYYEHALVDLSNPGPADYGALTDGFARAEQETGKFPPKLFSTMLLPSLETGAVKFGDLEARRRAALAALAIEHHRLQHDGRLPATLSELPGDESFAIDPYTGQPLTYVPSESGYLIYSRGRDGADQSGDAREKPSQDVYDVPFRVEWETPLKE